MPAVTKTDIGRGKPEYRHKPPSDGVLEHVSIQTSGACI